MRRLPAGYVSLPRGSVKRLRPAGHRVSCGRGTKEIARVNLPTDSIDLGEPGKEDIAQYRVTGYDAANNKLIRGESLFFQVGALEAASLPIFVSRTGELARVPGLALSTRD